MHMHLGHDFMPWWVGISCRRGSVQPCGQKFHSPETETLRKLRHFQRQQELTETRGNSAGYAFDVHPGDAGASCWFFAGAERVWLTSTLPHSRYDWWVVDGCHCCHRFFPNWQPFLARLATSLIVPSESPGCGAAHALHSNCVQPFLIVSQHPRRFVFSSSPFNLLMWDLRNDTQICPNNRLNHRGCDRLFWDYIALPAIYNSFHVDFQFVSYLGQKSTFHVPQLLNSGSQPCQSDPRRPRMCILVSK